MSRVRLPSLVAAAMLALAALSVLVFTRPGRRAVRRLARGLDSHVEGFSEPNARRYAHFVAPLFQWLYERVTDDVATELAARSVGHGLAILDIGCGPGDLAAMLANRLPETRIVGLDLSPRMVEFARARATPDGRLRFEVGDAADLPFEPRSIDVVVSTLSLHHWPNAGDGFREIRRVLRPGGVALLYDLRLLTVEAETLSGIAFQAGLPTTRLRRERLSGNLPACFFVRFQVDGPVEEPAPDVSPAARSSGHARIPAAVAPGEVA